MLENETKVGDVLTAVPPGISWTAEPKSRPWMKPPQHTDVTTIARGYMMSLGQPEATNDVLDALETKVPLATIAETFMLANVAKGRHTLDAGVLVMPVIIEVLKSIAEFNKIETVLFQEELEKGTTIHPRVLRQYMEKMKNKSGEPVVEEPMPIEEPKGLMARKNKEVV